MPIAESACPAHFEDVRAQPDPVGSHPADCPCDDCVTLATQANHRPLVRRARVAECHTPATSPPHIAVEAGEHRPLPMAPPPSRPSAVPAPTPPSHALGAEMCDVLMYLTASPRRPPRPRQAIFAKWEKPLQLPRHRYRGWYERPLPS